MYVKRARREETYDNIPSNQMSTVIPDGSSSSSERPQRSGLIENSSQSTLGIDNSAYIGGSMAGDFVENSNFSRDQLTAGYNADNRHNSYLNSDLNLRAQAFNRNESLPDPPANMI